MTVRVDPGRLRFVDKRLHRANRDAPHLSKRFEDLVAALPEDLFRGHPRGEGPDFAKEVMRLVAVGERPH